MRPSLFLPLLLGGLLCLGGVARAQQQESRMDQILKPDLGRAFNISKEKQFGSRGFDSSTNRVLDTRNAATPKKFEAKDFLTGSFHNDKSFWMGDFKYSTSSASTGSRFLFLFPSKKYGTKDVAVKTFHDKGSYNDSAVTTPTRDFRGKEREKLNKSLTPEQAANNGYRGDLTELKSIDDVRALLNKSK